MTWEFETDADFQLRLDWAFDFVRDEVEPLDDLIVDGCDLDDPIRKAHIPPLQKEVQSRGLWACHLSPDLGGQGYGQVNLALLNEILGRSHLAPVVFGCQAPDSGNAEILANFASEELKRQFLEPLLRNDIVSAFSMTEPSGGSNPALFSTTATENDEGWVLNGEKWFTTNARFASFLIVLAVTETTDSVHDRMSMFVVPRDTPGVEIVRDVGIHGHRNATHAYIRYNDVRVPKGNILGHRGEGFAVAQSRLGPGRIHHAMRALGQANKAFDAMCKWAISRSTGDDTLADMQAIQQMIAQSWIQIEQLRLQVMHTAWKIDRVQDYKKVKADISAVKIAMPRVLHDVASRALQIHGSLGVSDEMPFGSMLMDSFALGLVDGPTEVHEISLTRDLLKPYMAQKP